MSSANIGVRVARKSRLAEDICSFDLVAQDGAALPPFTAGAHVDVHVPGGPLRQYSLCNHPAGATHYRIAVLREAASRGGSLGMHERLSEGETLTISAPKNHFPLADGAAHSVLVAGGIGITPILAMAQVLAGQGASFELHYCTRSAARTAFAEFIAGSPLAARTHFHFDDGPAAQKLDIAALVAAPRTGTHLYVCGPKGFMDAVLGAARGAGWPAAQLHYEFFANEAPAHAGDGAFELQLAKSGRVLMVPAGQTALRVLEAAGVMVPSSCEQGVCGTCLTRVLEGVPDHRDLYMTPEEQAANDQFTPCCSRALSPRLVLEL